MKRHLTMITAGVASILVFSGCISFDGGIIPSSKSTMEDKFSASVFKASNGIVLPLRTYCPHDASPHSLPLVVYLHGAGQNGNDNKGQLDSSLGKIFTFTTSRDDYRALVAAPQCPREVYWRDDDVLEALKELIEGLSSLVVVDPNRVYITGFSMGGDASWKLALNWPKLMTTIVPVCGGPLQSMEPDIPVVPSGMADLNIWAFNNFDDGVVRPAFSKRVFGQLWSNDVSDRLNFTEGISGGHHPDDVYSNRDVLIWMMSTRKRD